MINKNLYSEIEAAGFRCKTFKVDHLNEISNDFEKLAAQGLLDEEFYKNNLTGFKYDYKSILSNAKSVIVIAIPQSKSLAEFMLNGKTIETVIPPTYRYPSVRSKVESILNNVLVKNGYAAARAPLPLKLLAVRSGLGQYGRNNICYVPGLGSFIRLEVCITDYDFDEDSWGETKVMDSCNTCSACTDNCPTGAIGYERFLIQAQKCITNINEYDTPIPEWIKPDWHDSIVGCMKCQYCCPQNKKLIDIVDEIIHFDEEETEMILDRKEFDHLPEKTRGKISNAGLEIYYNVLARNIDLLIHKM